MNLLDVKYKRGIKYIVNIIFRLLASNILIVNMTTNNTELNKNLILAGANITISDNQIINENDPHTNFLFTKFMIRIKSTQFIGY